MRAIIFAIHGCPAGWLGAYGNDWVGTPHLDRLASEGVTFDRHISDCPSPVGARQAWLGRSIEPDSSPGVSREGDWGGGSCHTILVRANHPDTDAPEWYYARWDEVFDARPQPDDDSPLDQLIRSFPTLLDRLAEIPSFLLWIETDRLIPPWDVQQDVFEAYLEDDDDVTDDTVDEEESEQIEDGERTEQDDGEEYEELEEEIVAVADEPVTPYADPPTGPFDRSDLDAWDWLHRTFAAVITKFDAELGLLFAELRRREMDRSATWLVTSDFGLPLGEHGQVGLHRPWLHEELVHLPLILRLPGAEQGGRRVSGFTQPPDLFPTLFALLGESTSDTRHGFNLLPLARGEEESARPYAITALELGNVAETAIRTDEWALILPTLTPESDSPRFPMLYAKPDDRWELNDLRSRNMEVADELAARIREVRGVGSALP